MEKLQALLDDGIIDEIYSQLKSGKEAEVWLVSHRGEAVAAKLYKEREFRNFKNDAGYKEGRQVRNTRTQRAMDKGSKFGRQASEDAWKSAEADAMETLHKLGVRVPKPVLFYDGVLLMEVIGDAEGRVAPRLVEASITREQAGAMYVLLRGDVVKMLAADLIHGDLSEFNILLGATGPVIIDFPQVVTAAKNSQSEQYFRRDIGNLLRFFSSIDSTLTEKHANDAEEIWRAYVRRHLSPHFTPGGRALPQQQRRGADVPQQRRGPPRGNQQGGPEVSFSGAPRGNLPTSQPQSQSQQPRGGRPQNSAQRRGPEVSFSGAPRDNSPTSQPPRRGPEVSVTGVPRGNLPTSQPPRRGPEVSVTGAPRGNLPTSQPPRHSQQARGDQSQNDAQRRGPEVSVTGALRENPPTSQRPRHSQHPRGDQSQNDAPRRGPEVGFSGAPRGNPPTSQPQRRGPEVSVSGAPRGTSQPPSHSQQPRGGQPQNNARGNPPTSQPPSHSRQPRSDQPQSPPTSQPRGGPPQNSQPRQDVSGAPRGNQPQNNAPRRAPEVSAPPRTNQPRGRPAPAQESRGGGGPRRRPKRRF